jgi:hypothetical protein
MIKNIAYAEQQINNLGIQKLQSIITLVNKKHVKHQVDLKGLIIQIISAIRQAHINYFTTDKGSYCVYHCNKFILSFLYLLKEQGFIYNYYVIPKILFDEFADTKRSYANSVVIIYFNFDATI